LVFFREWNGDIYVDNNLTKSNFRNVKKFGRV